MALYNNNSNSGNLYDTLKRVILLGYVQRARDYAQISPACSGGAERGLAVTALLAIFMAQCGSDAGLSILQWFTYGGEGHLYLTA